MPDDGGLLMVGVSGPFGDGRRQGSRRRSASAPTSASAVSLGVDLGVVGEGLRRRTRRRRWPSASMVFGLQSSPFSL